MSDCISGSDANFNTCQQHFFSLSEDALGTGVATLFDKLEALQAPWISDYPPNMVAKDVAGGLPFPKTGNSPAPVLTTRPVGTVDTGQRCIHVVNFRDKAASGKAKSKGESGCEIWLKVGDSPPATMKEAHFPGLDIATPDTAHYEMEDAGKTACYLLRWVNTRGEPGPWPETLATTIAR